MKTWSWKWLFCSWKMAWFKRLIKTNVRGLFKLIYLLVQNYQNNWSHFFPYTNMFHCKCLQHAHDVRENRTTVHSPFSFYSVYLAPQFLSAVSIVIKLPLNCKKPIALIWSVLGMVKHKRQAWNISGKGVFLIQRKIDVYVVELS